MFFDNRRSKEDDQLEMKVELDHYKVPTNARSAVNHGLDAAATAGSSISKEATRIKFVSYVMSWLHVK